MHSRFALLLLSGFLTAAAVPAAHSADPATPEPIRIGDIALYTGEAAMVRPYKAALDMAVKEINDAGGLMGRKVEIISRDSKSSPAESVRLAQELVLRDKVSAIINCDLSSSSMAVGNLLSSKNMRVPLIVGCSETDSIIWGKTGNDVMFRVAAGAYMIVSGTFKKAIEIYGDQIKDKRWVSLAQNFEYGHSMVESAHLQADKHGLNANWVGEQWPAYDRLNAGATVGALGHDKPDVLLTTMISSDLAKFVREGNNRSFFKDRIIISPQVALPDHFDMLKTETPEGWVSSGFPVDEISTPEFVVFRDKYAQFTKEPLRTYTLGGYNAVQALAAAIIKAGSAEPTAIIAAFPGIKYNTPLGEQTIREIDHQATTPFWVGVTKIVNGVPKLVNWSQEKAEDHLPSDEWIKERRAK